MKKRILFAVIIACTFAATSCMVEGGYVTERPGEVVYARPVAPGPGYLWIDGDWFWSGGRYVWHEGHWDRPRGGRAWVGGGWHQGPRGWRWQRGHWR
jgi:hypothetical protein